MKMSILTVVAILCPLNFFAQTESLNDEKYKTAKIIFENSNRQQIQNINYKISNVKSRNNKVILNNIETIKFKGIDFKGLSIIEKGLLNPKEINGESKISICCIEELLLLNPNTTTKRFKIWVFPYNERLYETLENEFYRNKKPSEYYFELKNENYTENMTWQDFVKNAKLTFIAFGKKVE